MPNEYLCLYMVYVCVWCAIGCIGCTSGSARCVGNSQPTDQCCAYYLDDICVQYCPDPLVANTDTFNCGEFDGDGTHGKLELKNC